MRTAMPTRAGVIEPGDGRLRLDRCGLSCFFHFVRLTPALLELDGMVINIELTLTSIIQGVALYFLTDNARVLLSKNNAASWLYVVAGLVIILIFWSRSITHTPHPDSVAARIRTQLSLFRLRSPIYPCLPRLGCRHVGQCSRLPFLLFASWLRGEARRASRRFRV